MPEVNFDGFIGPTHHYGGLSKGNLASGIHKHQVSSPQKAALQGLRKMKTLHDLGLVQGFIPPLQRPDVSYLRMLGFTGSDVHILSEASRKSPELIPLISSASSMWTANAATVAPAGDTLDGLLHLQVANLSAMAHRAIEAPQTFAALSKIFANSQFFKVHEALPSHTYFGDEGAANHTRFTKAGKSVHLFAWGISHFLSIKAQQVTQNFVARQSLEASQAVARTLELKDDLAIFHQQKATGIDAGSFHTDVLAVGFEDVLLVHEDAFVDLHSLIREVEEGLESSLHVCVAKRSELPLADAISAYPFNSQIVRTTKGLEIIAPLKSFENKNARAYFERVKEEIPSIKEVHYMPLDQSMNNGGGPACLRLRVYLEKEALSAVHSKSILNDALFMELENWVIKHYREEISLKDLYDPLLWREAYEALDHLTQIISFGAFYDFQKA